MPTPIRARNMDRKPLVKPQHIKVFEFSPSLAVEALKGGVAHVKNLWGE